MILTAVNVIGEAMMFLGKVIEACTSAFVCFWYLGRTEKFQAGGSAELSSDWLCVLVRVVADGEGWGEGAAGRRGDEEDSCTGAVCAVWC